MYQEIILWMMISVGIDKIIHAVISLRLPIISRTMIIGFTQKFNNILQIVQRDIIYDKQEYED